MEIKRNERNANYRSRNAGRRSEPGRKPGVVPMRIVIMWRCVRDNACGNARRGRARKWRRRQAEAERSRIENKGGGEG